MTIQNKPTEVTPAADVQPPASPANHRGRCLCSVQSIPTTVEGVARALELYSGMFGGRPVRAVLPYGSIDWQAFSTIPRVEQMPMPTGWWLLVSEAGVLCIQEPAK